MTLITFLNVLSLVCFIFYMIINYIYIRKRKNSDPEIKPFSPPTNPTTIVRPPDTTSLNYVLQAYERVVLLSERIYPPKMILKLYSSSLKVLELQAVAVDTIEKEYEHNITQQIYVNHKIWKSLVAIKDNHILAIHTIANESKGQPASIFVSKIIQHYDVDEIRQQHALLLEAIQQETKKVLKINLK